jgi:hypothetical protein
MCVSASGGPLPQVGHYTMDYVMYCGCVQGSSNSVRSAAANREQNLSLLRNSVKRAAHIPEQESYGNARLC